MSSILKSFWSGESTPARFEVWCSSFNQRKPAQPASSTAAGTFFRTNPSAPSSSASASGSSSALPNPEPRLTTTESYLLDLTGVGDGAFHAESLLAELRSHPSKIWYRSGEHLTKSAVQRLETYLRARYPEHIDAAGPVTPAAERKIMETAAKKLVPLLQGDLATDRGDELFRVLLVAQEFREKHLTELCRAVFWDALEDSKTPEKFLASLGMQADMQQQELRQNQKLRPELEQGLALDSHHFHTAWPEIIAKVEIPRKALPERRGPLKAWMSDDAAKVCPAPDCANKNTPFSLTFRRHHCRCCGVVQCQDCSSYWTRVAKEDKRYDPATEDSDSPGLLSTLFSTLVSTGSIAQDGVRVCKDCNRHLHSKERMQLYIMAFSVLAPNLGQMHRCALTRREWWIAIRFVATALRDVQYKFPTEDTFTSTQVALLRASRRYFVHHARWMVQYLKSVNWEDPVTSREALDLLGVEKSQPKHLRVPCSVTLCADGCDNEITSTHALELLSPRISHQAVRTYAVERLWTLPDPYRGPLLSVLVSSLAHEPAIQHSPLLKYLIHHAIIDLNFRFALYFALHIHLSEPSTYRTYQAAMEIFVLELTSQKGKSVVEDLLSSWIFAEAFQQHSADFNRLADLCAPDRPVALPHIPSLLCLAIDKDSLVRKESKTAPVCARCFTVNRDDYDAALAAITARKEEIERQLAEKKKWQSPEDARTIDAPADSSAVLLVSTPLIESYMDGDPLDTVRAGQDEDTAAADIPKPEQVLINELKAEHLIGGDAGEDFERHRFEDGDDRTEEKGGDGEGENAAAVDKAADSALADTVVSLKSPASRPRSTSLGLSEQNSSNEFGEGDIDLLADTASLGAHVNPTLEHPIDLGFDPQVEDEAKTTLAQVLQEMCRTGELCGVTPHTFLFKPEDLRRDALVMSVIELVESLLSSNEKLNLVRTVRYAVQPTSPTAGFLEIVPQSMTIGEINNENEGNMNKHFKDVVSKQINIARSVTELEGNMLHSLALVYVLNYLLQIKDRHTDNAMIQNTTGKVFGIDFGFMLGTSAKINLQLQPALHSCFIQHMTEEEKGTLSFLVETVYLTVRPYLTLFAPILLHLGTVRPAVQDFGVSPAQIEALLKKTWAPGYSNEEAATQIRTALETSVTWGAANVDDASHSVAKTVKNSIFQAVTQIRFYVTGAEPAQK